MKQEILYEVVLTVDPKIRVEYLEWLSTHQKEMMEIDGFLSVTRLENTENKNEITCHYWLRNIASMENYLSNFAPKMRADGLKKFGERFTARRRILAVAKS